MAESQCGPNIAEVGNGTLEPKRIKKARTPEMRGYVGVMYVSGHVPYGMPAMCFGEYAHAKRPCATAHVE